MNLNAYDLKVTSMRDFFLDLIKMQAFINSIFISNVRFGTFISYTYLEMYGLQNTSLQLFDFIIKLNL